MTNLSKIAIADPNEVLRLLRIGLKKVRVIDSLDLLICRDDDYGDELLNQSPILPANETEQFPQDDNQNETNQHT